MHLTPSEIDLVRTSFDQLKADKSGVKPFGDAFYARVFEKLPESRQLFREDLDEQGMQFLSTLHVVVDHLEDIGQIDRELSNLGRGHAAFGVRAAHYAPMGEALMETMRGSLGADFDAETEAAWRKAYGLVAERMVAAAG